MDRQQHLPDTRCDLPSRPTGITVGDTSRLGSGASRASIRGASLSYQSEKLSDIPRQPGLVARHSQLPCNQPHALQDIDTTQTVSSHSSRYRKYPNLIEIYVPTNRASVNTKLTTGFYGVSGTNTVDSQSDQNKPHNRGPSQRPKPPQKGGVRETPPKENTVFELAKLDNFVPFVIDLDNVDLPPLLKKFSWTLASPFKEEKYHRSVSNSIGNNYSPSATDINMKQMGKRGRPGAAGT
ncbi:hypothetical protein O5D80_004135 [Batrachochytrium dendrobatidis]|nr:hypothetical protein O5D80_004135 [Batrachochytrium dendrobatidis]